MRFERAYRRCSREELPKRASEANSADRPGSTGVAAAGVVDGVGEEVEEEVDEVIFRSNWSRRSCER